MSIFDAKIEKKYPDHENNKSICNTITIILCNYTKQRSAGNAVLRSMAR